MKVRRYQLIRALVIGAAIVGVAAPAAQAGHRDLDRSVGRSVRDTPSVTIVEPSGFDWGDAGVGAAGAFGLMVLAGGVVIVSRPSNRGTAGT